MVVAARRLDDDPVLAALLCAPVDDLPESEEEREAVRAAKASGQLVPHAEVEAMLASWQESG